MSNGTSVLLVQDGGDVAQPGTRLHSRNVLLGVISDVVHLVELDNQVAILSTESERCVTVATGLGGNLDAELFAALHRVLNVLGGSRDGDGGGEVGQTDVERCNILVPAVRALDIDRDTSIGKTLVDDGLGDEGIDCGGNQASKKGRGDTHAGQQSRDCSLRTNKRTVRNNGDFISSR